MRSIFATCPTAPFVVALLLSAIAGPVFASGKTPGTYEVTRSNDDTLCRVVQGVVNDGIVTTESTKEVGIRLADWRVVTDVPHVEVGALEETSIDIDNDRKADRVFRWKASLHGTRTAQLFIFDPIAAKELPTRDLTLKDLFRAPRNVYINGSLWLQSIQKKHTRDWAAWTAGFIAELEVFTRGSVQYVLAYSPEKPRKYSAEAIVLQFLPKGDAKGICMMHRTCPCGGCEDLRGRGTEQFLPSKGLCK